MQRINCAFGENANRNASPCGNAVEELNEVEINLISVLRGRKYTAKPFRRISVAKRCFRVARSPGCSEFENARWVRAKEGHRESW